LGERVARGRGVFVVVVSFFGVFFFPPGCGSWYLSKLGGGARASSVEEWSVGRDRSKSRKRKRERERERKRYVLKTRPSESAQATL